MPPSPYYARITNTGKRICIPCPSRTELENFNIPTAIGDKLEWQGKYLGKGSFGRVIKVKHRTDKCDYAVKLIPCIPGKREKYRKRELQLLTEQVCSPTPHVNIVKYYDSWKCTMTTPSLLCIRMELCDLNLETLLQTQNRVVDDPRFYWNLFPQILNGLEYLHNKIFWVHRDIYPPNILLAIPENALQPIHSRVVKIADFGLARKLESSLVDSDPPEEVLSAVGNKLYRAPEMKPKMKADPRAEKPDTGTENRDLDNYDFKVDLYSAGLVLYRMCCYFENGFVVRSELERIQDSGLIDPNKLSHHHDVLHQLLNGLLKRNPEERLSASQALACFRMSSGHELPPDCLSETDGPRTPKVLARKSSSSNYIRVHSHDARSYDTLLTCLIKNLKINDIECFNIIEEADRQTIKNITDWEILLSSANRGNRKVNLVVEPKSEDEPDLC